MDLNNLIVRKQEKTAELERFITVGEAEKRELTQDETESFTALEGEIRDLENQIQAKNIIPKITINTENRMNEKTQFSDLLVRKGDHIEDFRIKPETLATRAVTLSTTIDNVQVAGNISSVGYEPFYKSMGVSIMPNLVSSVKLPFVNGTIASKQAEGGNYSQTQTLATILLQPARYTITDTIGKEILSVGNEQALQAYLYELAKGCDRAITADIFNVIYTQATSQTGLTGYTTANMDTLIANVDGNVKLLMPRTEFYRAKSVILGTSGLFLASRDNQFAGHLWDGTELFYSNLFAPGVSNTIIAADLEHVVVGEFGNEYEIIFDIYSKAPQGQVQVTVVKQAGVVLRNTLAVKKAAIA